MGIRRYNPTSPGRRGGDGERLCRPDAWRPAGEELARAEAAHRRPEQSREDHRAVSRRRTQARLPADRFSSRQGRSAGRGLDSIQYDPNRTARIALLHYVDGEKRYILCPEGPNGRHQAAQRRGRAVVGRQQPAAGEDSAWNGHSQYRDAAGPWRRSVSIAPGRMPRWQLAMPTGRRSTFPAVKFAVCRRPVVPRSVR